MSPNDHNAKTPAPKTTPAPLCACGRSKVLTSDPLERWQCPRWTCTRQRSGRPDVTKDAHKLRAAVVLLGAVEELRQVGQRALEELASDGAMNNPEAILSALEVGAENIAHAVAPVSDAINYWRRGAPPQPTPQASSEDALTLEQCARCGVWVSGACACSKGGKS